MAAESGAGPQEMMEGESPPGLLRGCGVGAARPAAPAPPPGRAAASCAPGRGLWALRGRAAAVCPARGQWPGPAGPVSSHGGCPRAPCAAGRRSGVLEIAVTCKV